MSAIEKRLLATLSMGVISGGDRFERSVAEKQVKEAVDEIVALRARVGVLEGALESLIAQAEQQNEAYGGSPSNSMMRLIESIRAALAGGGKEGEDA